MTQNEFNVVLEQQYRKCADVLVHKKKEYTGDRIDRLSAFKIAASLQGCTPKTALAGMMSKHVVSLYDMCYSSLLQFELEQWDEKITDCINYLILLKALIKEEKPMDHIETKILNSYTIQEAAQNMVFAARLTQQGHSIQNMDDLMALYQKSFTDKTVDRIASLPHPTVQKFTVITVAIVGASRRFLAQITRHQNEVKFMSASLQYSNYSEKAAFVIPYEILFSEQRYIDLYLQSCLSDLRCYQELCSVGFHHDSAGYALPHALRNILIICATPYEWKHMISQRICRRNTDETRIVMLDIWQKLYEFDPVLFSPKLTGPFCQRGCCEEGAMSCGIPIPKDWSPLEIMKADYPLLVEGREAVYEN